MRSAGRKELSVLKRARVVRSGPLLVRHVGEDTELQVAFAIPAKGTTAVARNRLRRQLRESLRELEVEMGLRGTVLISVSAVEPQRTSDVEERLRSAFTRLDRGER